MSDRLSALLGLFLAAFLLSTMSACGHDQQLESITVIPAVENFGSTKTPVIDDAGLNVQLRALGTYIHPPVTKDITSQVTWSSNTTQMVTVDQTGLITVTGGSCGNTLVSATMKAAQGGIQTGFMTANVVCFTGTGPVGPNLVV